MQILRGQDTIVDSSLMETSRHGSETFPFAVYLDDFSSFKADSICWHWHEEAQITYIAEGEFYCHVGSEKLLLRPGELVFINSRALHQIVPCERGRGKLYAFLWRPELLGRVGGDVYAHCIEPMLSSPLRHVFFPLSHELNRQLQASLRMVIRAAREKPPCFELDIVSQLSRIWLRLCRMAEGKAPSRLPTLEKDEEKVKLAMSYIQANYREKISLDSIAKAAITNRAELCRCFRRVLDMTPGDFLLQFRLTQALSMLEDPELRVAEIAERCGFCSPSHFGSHFARHLGCTPLQYRKSI